MKRVLVLSFSPIRTDPRVMRQIRLLQDGFELTVAGFGDKPSGDFSYHDISAAPASLPAKVLKAGMLLTGQHEAYYWRMSFVRKALAALRGQEFDLVIANDVNSLAVALRLAGRTPVLLDAHEYSPREFEDLWQWRLFFQRFYSYLCNHYLPRVAGMTTVCEGIAQEYRQFGVKPVVVLNCPPAHELPVRPVDPGHIRLIHHGVSIPSRKLELMLEMMKHLDSRYTLDLMLVDSNRNYLSHLHSLAKGDSRIRFRPPVAMEHIVPAIHEYDIGVFLLPPVNFNYRMALPNKFFEYIQARLAVAIGPSPEMARLAGEYGFGIVADSFHPQDLARCVAALSPVDIEMLKHRSNEAAHRLNAATTAQIFLTEVKKLVS